MPEPSAGPGRPDPGSFRDPASRVFERDGEILRLLSPHGWEGWEALMAGRLLGDFTSSGRLVATEAADEAGRVLRHERLPFVSYPYEWTFSMLRAAALLHLDLLEAALAEDLTLKDATPYNVQFRGARPVFIDVGSFDRLEPNEPWLGFRQFCRMFLFPLMLRGYRDIPFQPWLRGSVDGIDAATARAVLRGRDLLRPGVLTHVALQARAERATAGRGDDVRSALAGAGLPKSVLEANLRRMRRIVERIEWRPAASTWSDYATGCAHVPAQRQAKEAFLARVLGRRRPAVVWDLGANDGHFSRLAAAHAGYVLAIDGDELVLDRLYRSLAADGAANLQPLLIDLAQPSPALGWRGTERRRLEDRSSPDLVLFFAVVHHLVLGASIPLGEVVGWLRSLDAEVVFEWVPPADPMATRLGANKRAHEIHPDYTDGGLAAALAGRFSIEDEAPVEGRRLLLLRPT
jgi:hypothetical protein